jgi:hypothetical protein
MRAAWAAHLGTPPFPSAHAYYAAIAVLTIAAFALLLLVRRWEAAAYALLVLQAAMAVNVVTHVIGAIAIGGYAPGLVTALLVEAPVSIVVFRRYNAGVTRSKGGD